MLRVRCCHGDMKEYPTAQVEVEVEDRVMSLKAGVVPGLLKDVLLGTDVNDLVSLATVPEVCVHAVTRAQAKHHTQEDAEVRTREATSGARLRDIGSEVEVGMEIGTGSENPGMALGRFEDDVFGGVGRPRKTRKQRREAGKGWLGRPWNTPEGQKTTDPQPGEGTRDLEERLPAGIPRTIGADELKKLQAEDPSLTQVRRYAEMAKEQAGEETGFRWADGVLYRQWKPRKPRQHETVEQIVLPAQCRQMVMKLAHDRPTGGHLGRKKTQDRILQHFYWPNVFKEVAEYCKSCDRCQKTARVKASERAPLMPLPIIEEPFQRIAMDIVGPLQRTTAGNKYILVICDYATRYPEAFPLKSIDAQHVAERLWELFSRMGVPAEILTDQGTNFMSRLLQELYRMLGVKSIRTSSYHPQTDGLVERFNGTLKTMLRKFTAEEKNNWDQLLPFLLFAYREVPQASTGFSPFELMFGRRVRGPLDILGEQWEAGKTTKEDVVSYVLSMRERLALMSEIAQENMRIAQAKQKSWYDQKSRDRSFEEGEQVLVLLPSTTQKLQAEWGRVPFW